MRSEGDRFGVFTQRCGKCGAWVDVGGGAKPRKVWKGAASFVSDVVPRPVARAVGSAFLCAWEMGFIGGAGLTELSSLAASSTISRFGERFLSMIAVERSFGGL